MEMSLLARFLALGRGAFGHGASAIFNGLRRRDDGDGIPAEEYRTELASDLSVYALFSVFEDDVNVNVERPQISEDLLAVL